jgi:hypothetical protein
MPKPLFCGVCASSITPFHPDGSREGLWQINLGYEVHMERMG